MSNALKDLIALHRNPEWKDCASIEVVGAPKTGKTSLDELQFIDFEYPSGLEKAEGKTIARYMSINSPAFDWLCDNSQLSFTEIDYYHSEECSNPDFKEQMLPEGVFIGFQSKGQIDSFRKTRALEKEWIHPYSSSWHLYEKEDRYMWDTYADNARGVCIVTTTTKLLKAIEKPCIGGQIQYLPSSEYDGALSKRHITPPLFCLDRKEGYVLSNYRPLEFFKDKDLYEHEREYRVCVYTYGQQADSWFLPIDIDMRNAFDEIIVGPSCTEDGSFLDRLSKAFGCKVSRSSLVKANGA